LRIVAVASLLATCATPAGAALQVVDDAGNVVTLATPAKRIVSLAPHATELLFAAGAGARVVATVEFSDYPPVARELPRVGSSAGIDVERLVALLPDLVVGWHSGNPPAQLARLRDLGLTVFVTEPRHLSQLPELIERLGVLAGAAPEAASAARQLRQRATQLEQRYATRSPVSVFYQLLDPALMTINGEHIITDVIRLCGGRNVFADLPVLAGRIDIEAVLARDPQVIIGGGEAALWRQWQQRWLRWPQLQAVRHDRLVWMDPDLLHRAGPRMLDGAERLCAALDAARGPRAAR
jgi:iron complex transport system substrate-binding protein